MGTSVVIPLFSQISSELSLNMGVIEAGFVLVSTLFLLIWGYSTDRYNRKLLALAGTSLLGFSSILISLLSPEEPFLYVLLRIIMGIGLGSVVPVTYSWLGDLASFKSRGTVSAGIAFFGIIGSGVGILTGGLFGSLGVWRLAFMTIGIVSIALLVLLLLIQFPTRGSQEPELLDYDQNLLQTFNLDFRIDLEGVKRILIKRTNIWLFIEGTISLIPSTIFYYYLVTFFEIEIGTSLQVAVILTLVASSGRLLGYPVLGYVGDQLSQKNNSSRPKILVAAIGMGGQAPLMMVALLIPLEPVNSLLEAFFNPFYLGFIFFFFLGTFIGGSPGPNRRSALYDVNEPELRGSAGSLFVFTDQVGAICGLLFASIMIPYLGYRGVFLLVLVFYIISALSWLPALATIEPESQELRNIISERANSLDRSTS